jgi:hypothetical protein
MSGGLQRLSFDTSAVNALADSPYCAPLLAGIKSGYFTRLTFPSVAEPLATTDKARRNSLFEILDALRLNGECLEAHQWILKQLVLNNEKHGKSMWDTLALRFTQCEVEIARREFSDSESEEERKFSIIPKASSLRFFPTRDLCLKGYLRKELPGRKTPMNSYPN